MPKEGYKALTVRKTVYDKGEQFIIKYNYAKGIKAIRSMAHLIELALDDYIKKNKSIRDESTETE